VVVNVLADISVPGTAVDGNVLLNIVGPSGYTPRELTFGGSYDLANLTLSAEVGWLQWSRVTQVAAGIAVEADLGVDVPTGTFVEPPPNFRNTWVPRVGAEYGFDIDAHRRLTARAGYYYSPTPVPAQTGETNFADGNRHVVSVGGTYDFVLLEQRLGLELAFSVHQMPRGEMIKTNPHGLRRPSGEPMSRHALAHRVRLPLLALAMLTTGCGFLENPWTDGRPLNDGVGPWTDLGSIQTCVGGRRLLETVVREGMCRAEAQIPSACDVDADCPDDESCVCGRCTVRFCEGSDQCRDGQVCGGSPRRCVQRCTADEECGPYGVCNGGACERACWTQDDCPVSELCLVGRCAAVGCGENGPNCFPGEVCELQSVQGSLGGPEALMEGDRIVLFSEVSTAAVPSAIMRFESADGLHFDAVPETPVLAPSGTQTRVARPSVVQTDAGLYLFVELDDGASIGQSLDPSGTGESFPDATVALVPGTWEGGIVHSPSVALVDGTLVLAYEGGDGLGIGLSVEDAGGAFAPATAPVLVPGDLDASPRWEGVTSIGAPDLVFVESSAGRPILRLYVTGFGLVVPAEPGGPLDVPTYSIGYAAAVYDTPTDQPTFDLQAYNPTFARVVNFTPLDESESSVIPYGESWLLYYLGGSSVRVAINPLVLTN